MYQPNLTADNLEPSRRPRIAALAAICIVLAIIPFLLPNAFYFDVANRIAILAIHAVALNLLIGYTGQINLGHAGFIGIGAYGSGVLTTQMAISPIGALVCAALLAGFLAYVVGRTILRLKGHYLAMATLGLGIIISIIITNESKWTGGPDGLAIGAFHLAGIQISGERQWYFIFAFMLVGTIILAQNLIDSPAGRALQALHGSEIAASIVGIDVARTKVGVFVLSSVVASIMGSLEAHYSGYINPGISGFMQSVELVTMVVLGGMSSIFGSVVGAILLGLLPQFLAHFEGWDTVLFGLILAVTIIFLPRGIVPTVVSTIRLESRPNA